MKIDFFYEFCNKMILLLVELFFRTAVFTITGIMSVLICILTGRCITDGYNDTHRRRVSF